MRTLPLLLGVVLVVVVVVVRAVHAEPPPPMESRSAAEVLQALEQSKTNSSTLAAVRWYVEVTHGTTLEAPVGSPKTTLGAWSDNGALLAAESALGSCEPMKKEDAAAALALLKRTGDALPPLLRGVALREKGDATGAERAFVDEARATLPAAGCPSEHPMYSFRRVSRLSVMASCLARWKAKDAAAVKALLERAKTCAANNHAVG